MRFCKVLSVFLFLFFIRTSSYGQGGQSINFSRPSPVSASLERYGDYPTTLFTGVPDIRIPIYKIVSGDLVLPIELSYHASGIKEDDQSHPIALGWSLMAGGRISRTLRDKPDEKSTPMSTTLALSQTPSMTNDKIYGMDLQTRIFSHDNQADLFYYSFGVEGGAGGRFLFDGTKKTNNNGFLSEPLFFPSANIKFSPSYSTSNPYLSNLHTMLLTDDMGRKFKFGGTEEEYIESKGYSVQHFSAWMLNEVYPANGDASQKIKFDYKIGPEMTILTYEGSMSIIDSIHFQGGPPMLSQDGVDAVYVTSSQNTTPFHRIDPLRPALVSNYNNFTAGSFRQQGSEISYTRDVEKISFSNGEVRFFYHLVSGLLEKIVVYNLEEEIVQTAFLYQSKYTGEERYKLDSVVVKGTDAESVKTYRLEYEQGISGFHNSFARDLWGYYNGMNNETLIPRWGSVPVLAHIQSDVNGNDISARTEIEIGNAERGADAGFTKRYVLKKMIYPTGGYTEYEYELNKLWAYDHESIGSLAKDVGGLRVKKIVHSADGIKKNTRKFIYGKNEDGLGVPNNYPHFSSFYTERNLIYSHYPTPVIINGVPTYLNLPQFVLRVGRRRDFHSSPNRMLNQLDGSAVWYEEVTEVDVDADGVENGKIISTFLIPEKDEEFQHSTNGVFYGPRYTSVVKGYNQPKLTHKRVYKKQGNDFLMVQEENNEYQVFSTDLYYANSSAKWQSVNDGLVITLDDDLFYHSVGYEYILAGYADVSSEIRDNTYFPISNKLINHTYDGNGTLTNTIEKVTEISYTRGGAYIKGASIYPSSITNYGSSSTPTVEHFVYPMDLGSLTSNNALVNGYKNLQTKNVVSIPVEKTRSNNGYITSNLSVFDEVHPEIKELYEYKSIDNTSAFANLYSVGGNVFKDSKYRLVTSVDKYASSGNLLQYKMADDIPQSASWGNKNQEIFASAANAKWNEIFFDSFEDGTLWSNTSFDHSRKHSGKKSAKINSPSSAEVTALSPGWLTISNSSAKKYRFSTWFYSDGPVAELVLYMKTASETAPFTSISAVSSSIVNKWTLLEGEFEVPSNITQLNIRLDNNGSGNVWFDDVRLHPSNAQMTSYTYTPLVGMTSSSDPNNKITYYEYDGFGRLHVVKDENRNVLKRICYNYAGQPEPCKIYYNVVKSQAFTRSNCGTNYQGSSYTYTVNANTYVGSSQAEADQLALDDIALNGQAAANSLGTCTLVYNSVDVSGYYYSQNCPPNTAEAIYVYMPSASYTSSVSQTNANALAIAAAQEYANTYGSCMSSGFNFVGTNNSGTGMTVVLTNTDTYQSQYFNLGSYTYFETILGVVEPGYYNVELLPDINYYGYSYSIGGFYNYTSNYTYLFGVYLDGYSNLIEIY